MPTARIPRANSLDAGRTRQVQDKARLDCDEQLNTARVECNKKVESLEKQNRNLAEIILIGEKHVENLTNDFNKGVQAWNQLYDGYAVLQHENTDYKAALEELEDENMRYRVAVGKLIHQVDQVTGVHENLVQMYQVQARVLDNAIKKCDDYKVKLDRQKRASHKVTLALENGYIGSAIPIGSAVPEVPHRPQTPPLGFNDPEPKKYLDFIPAWVPESNTPMTPRQIKTGAFQVVSNGKPGPLTERQAALYAALHQHDQ